MLEPTEEEKKNGWTAEKLTEYVKDRKINQASINHMVFGAHFPYAERKNPNPENKREYNPHSW